MKVFPYPWHLHHVAFPVEDLDRSIGFYVETLGFEEAVRRKIQGGYLGTATGRDELCVDLAVLRLGKTKLELIRYLEPPAPPAAPVPGQPGGPHLNLLVNNLAKTHQFLRDKGVRFISDPVLVSSGPNQGGQIAFLLDPDGYRVELMELTPTRLRELGFSRFEYETEKFVALGGGLLQTLGHSQTLGWLERGSPPAEGAVVVDLPETLDGAERSVCGVKGFLVDERREFTRKDKTRETVDCARVAALDIVDSPVHAHGETVETYHILKGRGQMVLGDEVVEVHEGKLILIPPGVPHGLCACNENPVRVLMTFSPGLAPVTWPEFRDEKILHASTRETLARKSR